MFALPPLTLLFSPICRSTLGLSLLLCMDGFSLLHFGRQPEHTSGSDLRTQIDGRLATADIAINANMPKLTEILPLLSCIAGFSL